MEEEAIAKTAPGGKGDNLQPRIHEMRILGWSYRAIGKQLGISHTAARKSEDKFLRQEVEENGLHRQEVGRVELERNEKAMLHLWPRVLKGEPSAVEAFVRLQRERRNIINTFGLIGPALYAEFDKKRPSSR